MEAIPGITPFTLLFATDPHGSESAYDQLLKEADRNAADAVVLGGDLTPHSDPTGQSLFLKTWLRPRLERFRQQNPTIRVFGLLGNDDWIANETLFLSFEADGLLFPLHRRAHTLSAGLWIAGCSYVPVTPFGISDWDRLDSKHSLASPKRRGPLFSHSGKIESGSINELLQRPTVAATLEELAQLSPPAQTVYVIHTPPRHTNLDVIYDRQHVGSEAVFNFIKQHQPPLTLHGHIHESREISDSISDQLGRTVAINPGDSREKLRAVKITLTAEGVTWKELT